MQQATSHEQWRWTPGSVWSVEPGARIVCRLETRGVLLSCSLAEATQQAAATWRRHCHCDCGTFPVIVPVAGEDAAAAAAGLVVTPQYLHMLATLQVASS